MKTILLTLILLLPLSSIAEIPCYQAIQMQHDSIDSLETRLKTAQSLPYNQGYQEGYKQAKMEQPLPLFAEILMYILVGVVAGLSFIALKLLWQLATL